MIRPWQWRERAAMKTSSGLPITDLLDGHGRDRATIWQNDRDRFTWHTWDTDGVGGENASATSLNDAKDQAVAAIVRQGWAPGGWKVVWP